MKKIITKFRLITGMLLLAANGILQAQNGINFVPNFSFEQYDTCPNHSDEIQYAKGWSKYSLNSSDDVVNTTPDYFNACAKSGICSVPYTGYGFRPDHRNCHAFAGLVTIQPAFPWYREYIGIQLNQPLIIGQKYYISFYTTASLVKIGYYYTGMWSNNIGVKLSTVAYSGSKPAPMNNYAHLRSTTIIKDTINWHLISGSIIADSAYDYLIIGNFFDDAHTDTLHYNCNICQNAWGYYYVDDICLSTDSLLCNGGIDKLPCNVGINEITFDNGINVYPNPVIDYLNISSKENLDGEISIYDLIGNAIYFDKIANKNNLTINLSSLTEGYYLLKITNKYNQSISKKLVKL